MAPAFQLYTVHGFVNGVQSKRRQTKTATVKTATRRNDDKPKRRQQFSDYSRQPKRRQTVLVCRRFGVSPFWLSPFRFVVVLTTPLRQQHRGIAAAVGSAKEQKRSRLMWNFSQLYVKGSLLHSDTGCQHTLVVDFETAAINAMSSVFPDATVNGCSFHFRQAIVRRVQKEGLMA